MITERQVKGNLFIYCLFQICNIALAVLGFFTMAISIYLVTLTKSLNTFNFLFFVFGILLIILSYYGCKLRNSPFGNFVYSIVLTAIFLADFILTIFLFIDKEELIKWVMKRYNTDKESYDQVRSMVDKNIDIVHNLLLAILLLFVYYIIIYSS